ncbi:DUF6221 family protein [Streptomyces youssoufiensis]
MSGMDDLVRWFGTQLNEDERIANAASWTEDATAWHAASSPFDTRGASQRWYVEDSLDEGVVTHVDPKASDDEGVARHIAEHDPARSLREVEAKRQVLRDLAQAEITLSTADPGTAPHDLMTGAVNTLRRTVRLLALAHADRPGYREGWRP